MQAFLPSVLLTTQGGINSLDGNKPVKSYSLAAFADWELDIFGKLRNAKEKDRASLAKSEAYRRAVQSSLVATIADSYYTLLMLDKQLMASNETVKSREENVRVMNALKAAGKATESATAQAEANKLAVESSALSLKRQIREVENSLSVLLGMAPQAIERGLLDEQDFPTELASGVPLQLLSSRPDIQQAEYVLAQSYPEPASVGGLYLHICYIVASYSDFRRRGICIAYGMSSLYQQVEKRVVI